MRWHGVCALLSSCYAVDHQTFIIDLLSIPVPVISVQITTSGAPSLGQSDYSLTCGVAGAENLPIAYQWTKNGAQTVIGTDEVLSFASLGFSDAGLYTCRATISSSYLSNDITMMDTQDITIQSKFGCILYM